MNKLIIILFAFLCACQVQKRKYMPGLYVHHSKTGSHEKQDMAERKSATAFRNNDPGVAGFERSLVNVSPSAKDSCDLLIFNDGTEIKAVIIDINDKQIKY